MTKIYEQLAALFAYPAGDYLLRVRECAGRMLSESPEAAAVFGDFETAIAGAGIDDLQELFTRTFDLNPVCSLEIGWHLFGEEYQRGEFLVKMRQELRARGIGESSELPDHLTHALALLARMDPDEAAQFAGQFILPALHKMRQSWSSNHNAYWSLLDSLFVLLKGRFAYQPPRTAVRVPELTVLQ
jgi:nitrate reductase delta subunit